MATSSVNNDLLQTGVYIKYIYKYNTKGTVLSRDILCC